MIIPLGSESALGSREATFQQPEQRATRVFGLFYAFFNSYHQAFTTIAKGAGRRTGETMAHDQLRGTGKQNFSLSLGGGIGITISSFIDGRVERAFDVMAEGAAVELVSAHEAAMWDKLVSVACVTYSTKM